MRMSDETFTVRRGDGGNAVWPAASTPELVRS